MHLDSLAQLFLELGAVLFGLGMLARLASRFGFSPIPLYLLAGLAFGSGGLLPIGAPRGFFETGSQIGVILLLLMIGLEYTAEDLVANLRTQAPAGVIDLLLNGLPGVGFALLMGWGPTEALAMFGITAVSSSGIISKVLTDLGRLGNRETPGVLGVLVLEDLAMAVYLPILTEVAASAGGLSAVASTIIALAVLAAVLFIALRFGPVVTRIVVSRSNEVLLLRLIGLAMLVAGAAEAAHVSAAVGAFLLGIALSTDVAERIHRIIEPLRDIFAAMFFVFFGLSTDPGQLPGVLLPALALAAVGIATKFGTGWVAGKRAGVGKPGRLRAGAALVPRGEFSIIIAGLVGTAAAPELEPVTAAYVLVLAIVGPLAPRLAEPLIRRFVLGRRPAPKPAVRELGTETPDA
ncbi:potassium transporter [Microlunatus endophyticus]|uniref:Potassium transporter n=1 Tax=Microlunatus endophyticus TaxID=1716077 RepID=A0A917SG41_9ACTN|nr:cation:proton antiporter [Microlunatus endophyticus]GGL80303.1 potassium transporter [Microlunatus endophyticus]